MDDKTLSRGYVSALRSRKKSGVRWQAIKEVAADQARPVEETREDVPAKMSLPTLQRNEEIAEEVTRRVRKLLDLAKQVLTERQYAVFVLVAVKDPALTEREAAKLLGISAGRAHQLSTASMEKLRRAYETRTA